MSWKLAHNLVVRSAAVKKCWPSTTIYSIGDSAHRNEHSDHNPDSRGVVHAIDVMIPAGAKATAVLKWCLAHTSDLQYIIHNHYIYDRSNSFRKTRYTGSDPHTNHVHISGRHGSTGKNSSTGVGYSTTAEKVSPSGTPCSYYDPNAFPLNSKEWYGVDDGTKASHSGLSTIDRTNIKRIQAKLKVLKDGSFGPGTAKAVKAFQKANKITVDGKVGPGTWAKLKP